MFRFEGHTTLPTDDVEEPVCRVGMRVAGDVLMTVSRVDDLELTGAGSFQHIIDWAIWNRGFIHDPYA
ncbi:MAG TPA: hypothetical protein VHG90_00865 [Acidimicrobiales bacterium]|nr:hypothetical protein [Acidimicrobiales bacterium]